MVTSTNPLDYIEMAQSLTGSNDINIIIDAAKKLAGLVPIAENPRWLPQHFNDFLKTTKILDPKQGLIPMVPYPFQEKFANRLDRVATTPHGRLIHCSSRQMGTSAILAAFGLWYALSNANKKILYVCPRLVYGTEMSDRIKRILSDLPYTYGHATNDAKLEKRFGNGSQINFRTYSSDATPAEISSSDLVILVDMAYCSYAFDESVNDALAMLRARGGKYVASSTPNRAGGLFWELCRTSRNEEMLVQPWTVHPQRDDEWVRPFRDQLGEAQFQSEFECQFISRDE